MQFAIDGETGTGDGGVEFGRWSRKWREPTLVNLGNIGIHLAERADIPTELRPADAAPVVIVNET